MRMSGKRIESVCHLVRKVCCTERHGGKCFVINDSTCVLHDYDEWNSQMHDKVKTKLPDVDIVCTHNTQSATSFSVVFTVESRRATMVVGLMLLGVMVVCVVVLSQMIKEQMGGCWPTGLRASVLSCRRL